MMLKKNMKNWLMKEMKEPKGKWVPHWGTKFTEGAKSNKGPANLGRVIGHDFITESKPHAKEQKLKIQISVLIGTQLKASTTMQFLELKSTIATLLILSEN